MYFRGVNGDIQEKSIAHIRQLCWVGAAVPEQFCGSANVRLAKVGLSGKLENVRAQLSTIQSDGDAGSALSRPS